MLTRVMFSGPENHDSQRCDTICHPLRPEMLLLSPNLRGFPSLNHTDKLWKTQNNHWREPKESNGDGVLKLQIPVACRGRSFFFGFLALSVQKALRTERNSS